MLACFFLCGVSSNMVDVSKTQRVRESVAELTGVAPERKKVYIAGMWFSMNRTPSMVKRTGYSHNLPTGQTAMH